MVGIVLPPPEHGPDPGQQLPGGKGLDQVVIGPQVQAPTAVLHLPFCGEQKDGRPVTLPAEGLQNGQAIRFGQHDIQKDAVVVPHPGIGQSLFPIGHAVHQIIVIGEDIGHGFGQSRLILSIQQFHRASPIF